MCGNDAPRDTFLDGTPLDVAWRKFRQAAPKDVDDACKHLLQVITAQAEDLQSHIIDINFADKEGAPKERSTLPHRLRKLLEKAEMLSQVCQVLCSDGTVAKDLGEECIRLCAETQAIQRELELLHDMLEILPPDGHVAPASVSAWSSTTASVQDSGFDGVLRAIAMQFGIPCSLREPSAIFARSATDESCETCFEDGCRRVRPDTSSVASRASMCESPLKHRPPSATSTLPGVASRSCLRRVGGCGILKHPSSQKVVRFVFDAAGEERA